MGDRRLRRGAPAIVVSAIGLGLALFVFRGPGHAADRHERLGGALDRPRAWLQQEAWSRAVRERAHHLAAENRVGAALATLRPLVATHRATDADRELFRAWEARLRAHPLARIRTIDSGSIDSGPMDRAPIDPVPIGPASTDSASSEPVSSEPVLINPVSTDPVGIDPALPPRLTISIHHGGLSVEESRLDVVVRGEPIRDGSTTRRTVTSLALGEHRDWLRSRLDAVPVLPEDPFVVQLEARRRALTERQYRRARSRSRDVAAWEEVPVFVSTPILATEVERRVRYEIRIDALHADGRFEQHLATAERGEVDRVAEGSVSDGRPADLLELTPLAEVERALRVQAEKKRDSVIASLRRQLEASIERDIERLESEHDWDAARDLTARLAFERTRLTSADEGAAAVTAARGR